MKYLKAVIPWIVLAVMFFGFFKAAQWFQFQGHHETRYRAD